MKSYYLICDQSEKMELQYKEGKEVIVDYKLGLHKFYINKEDILERPTHLKIKTISGKELNLNKKYIISIEDITIVSQQIYFFDNSLKKESILENFYKCYKDMEILDGQHDYEEDLDLKEYKIYYRYL